MVENLYLRVRKDEGCEEFSFWGYGDKDLVRGSGLFVPDTGVATNHHFNPVHSDVVYKFSPGNYEIELIAKLVSKKNLVSLWTTNIVIADEVFEEITPDTAIFYNWSEEQGRYLMSVKHR